MFVSDQRAYFIKLAGIVDDEFLLTATFFKPSLIFVGKDRAKPS